MLQLNVKNPNLFVIDSLDKAIIRRSLFSNFFYLITLFSENVPNPQTSKCAGVSPTQYTLTTQFPLASGGVTYATIRTAFLALSLEAGSPVTVKPVKWSTIIWTIVGSTIAKCGSEPSCLLTSINSFQLAGSPGSLSLNWTMETEARSENNGEY